jgi:putative ABC transport system substrate-binding protein
MNSADNAVRLLVGTCLVVVALVLSTAPPSSVAQAAEKLYRIGMLETRSAALNRANVDAFRQGLRELGYAEGHNLQIVYRSSDGRDDRFPGLAQELVALKVDLITTRGTPAALAAKNATALIPVVMAASGDPVGSGIVASLARPGGNVTGLSSGITESFPKRVELLRELLPGLKRIAAVLNMGNPAVPPQWRIVEASARSLGIEAQLLDVRRPEDIRQVFDTAATHGAEALIVGLDGVTQANLRSIADLAVKHRLPSIYPAQDYAKVGGLMTYGSSDFHMYRRAAAFADKIFKGGKPADLPVEQPTRWEFVVNLKTARALAVTIPHSLLLRADAVVE